MRLDMIRCDYCVMCFFPKSIILNIFNFHSDFRDFPTSCAMAAMACTNRKKTGHQATMKWSTITSTILETLEAWTRRTERHHHLAGIPFFCGLFMKILWKSYKIYGLFRDMENPIYIWMRTGGYPPWIGNLHI
jgi:hypothetical protein